jgi:hypothetical protein
MAAAIRIGVLEVTLPTASDGTFWLSCDLGEHLGVDNHEAGRLLRAALKAAAASKPPGRISVEATLDWVIVEAGNARAMMHLLDLLAATPAGPRLGLDPAALASAGQALAAHRRPRRQPWALGDVFTVPVGDSDGTLAGGQIVGVHERLPTCALFDFRSSQDQEVDPIEVVTSRTITILHSLGTDLADGTWRVVGDAPVTVDPWSGRHGAARSGRTWDGLGSVAEAWFGQRPWNESADERLIDEVLLPGVTRPATAWLLEPDQRAFLLERYRLREVPWREITEAIEGWRLARAPDLGVR